MSEQRKALEAAVKRLRLVNSAARALARKAEETKEEAGASSPPSSSS